MKNIKKTLLLNIILLVACNGYAQHTKPKVAKLTLLSGMRTMEYRFMLFRTGKGDTLCAEIMDSALIGKGYVQIWDSVGPPLRVLPQYTNKEYKVRYTPLYKQPLIVDGQPPYNMHIIKLELLK